MKTIAMYNINFDEEQSNIVPFIPRHVKEEARRKKSEIKRILAKYHRPKVAAY